jgi:hypothetical protein
VASGSYWIPSAPPRIPHVLRQYLRQIAKMGKNGVKAKNQLIDFIGLSKSHFCQKWLKTQIGEGIV